jgi:hypothetical protein
MALKNAASGWLEMEGFMTTIGFTVFFGFFALVLLTFGFTGINKAKNNTWTKINATVVKTENCEEGKCSKFDGRNGSCLRRSAGSCVNFFEYTVNGVVHTGSMTVKGKPASIGSQMMTEYDPTTPANYRTETMTQNTAILLLVTGFVCLLVSIGFGVCATSENCRSGVGFASMFSGRSSSSDSNGLFSGMGNFIQKLKN